MTETTTFKKLCVDSYDRAPVPHYKDVQEGSRHSRGRCQTKVGSPTQLSKNKQELIWLLRPIMNDQSGGSKGSRGRVKGKCKQLSCDTKRILDMFFHKPKAVFTTHSLSHDQGYGQVKAMDEEVAKLLEKKAIVKLQKD